MSSSAIAGAPVLRLRNVSKTFGRSQVLCDLNLDLYAGEVLGVVGQNGSGKSTLIKILAGYHQPDPGASAEIRGEPMRLGVPASSRSANIRFVHQDLGLVLSFSSVENFALTAGYRPSGGRIRWQFERHRLRTALDRIGFDFDVDKPVSQLRVGERVGLAIARALAISDDGSDRPSVLVLDEPTAALPASETAQLFHAIRAITAEGVPALYVSHRLDEVFDLTDRVLVLRDGKTMAVSDTVDLTHDGLITLMLGQSAELLAPAHHVERPFPVNDGQMVLDVTGLSGGALRSLDLRLSRGQIIGIAGVVGSGREEVGPLLGGERLRRSGLVKVNGAEVKGGSPLSARSTGIGYVPSDRKVKAAISQFSILENLTLLDLRPFSSTVRIRRRAEVEETSFWLDALDVRPRLPHAPMQSFSGGNQQKVILGRILRIDAPVIVLDEPTQGVDVGAKAAIHGLLRKAAAAGTVVILCSSDTEELVALADEVIVLKDGTIRAVIRGDGLTEASVNRAMLGGVIV